MNALAKINLRRAWALFTVLWLAVSAIWYAGQIEQSRILARQHKRTLDTEARDRLFHACLEQNKLSWTALVAEHGAQCRAQAIERCDGGDMWCSVDYWKDWCIRTSPAPCRDIGGMIESDGSPPLASWLSYANDQDLKLLVFYWGSGFSGVAKEALAIALGLPLALLLLPPVLRRLWAWLTHNPT